MVIKTVLLQFYVLKISSVLLKTNAEHESKLSFTNETEDDV